MPVQYILGKVEFMGLEFKVTPAVLIPRPETEILVEETVRLAARIKARPVEILDLGTGSGAIAISLTKFISDCKIMASDVSEAALSVAKENALSNGACDKVDFVESELFSDLPSGKWFDIIVSNPPYVAAHEFAGLQKEISFEPRLALDGGPDGLNFYRRIIKEAPAYLRENGFLALEIGFGQADRIKALFTQHHYCNISFIDDYSNIKRIAIGQCPPSCIGLFGVDSLRRTSAER